MRKFDRPKILAIASGGGHWIQLLRLRPAFSGADVTLRALNGKQPTMSKVIGFSGFRMQIEREKLP